MSWHVNDDELDRKKKKVTRMFCTFLLFVLGRSVTRLQGNERHNTEVECTLKRKQKTAEQTGKKRQIEEKCKVSLMVAFI